MSEGKGQKGKGGGTRIKREKADRTPRPQKKNPSLKKTTVGGERYGGQLDRGRKCPLIHQRRGNTAATETNGRKKTKKI